MSNHNSNFDYSSASEVAIRDNRSCGGHRTKRIKSTLEQPKKKKKNTRVKLYIEL